MDDADSSDADRSNLYHSCKLNNLSYTGITCAFFRGFAGYAFLYFFFRWPMAMILGVYDKLVSSVSSFCKHKKESFFLTLFSLGGGLGMLLFTNPLLSLIERYPMPMLYFFLGTMAGGVPLIFREAEIKNFSWKVPLYVIVGLLVVALFAILPACTFQSEMEAGIISFLLLMLAGFIAAVALVLPGISVSYLLLIMGLYDETMRAISELYLPFLVPLGIGLLLGIVLTTKVLEKVMTKHPQPTYLIIFGFVLGSMAEVFPGLPTGPELLLSPFMLAAGFSAIRLLSWKETKRIAIGLSEFD